MIVMNPVWDVELGLKLQKLIVMSFSNKFLFLSIFSLAFLAFLPYFWEKLAPMAAGVFILEIM
jgi:hypothetical protein